jgi:peptidoglycan/xylan/chitin deacetylase (PgdA/CDA1 family)/GT2 family glycosyltransferase
MESSLQPLRCSVIIPTRRRSAPLRKTLESLSPQTEKEFEVLVVVDGEDAETRSLAETYQAAFPLRWIFVPEHKGQASARNAGAAAAESDILIFLDDDTQPVPEWIHHHLKHHRANNGEYPLAVFGKVVDVYVHPPRSYTEQYLRESRTRTLDLLETYLKDQSLESAKDIYFGLNCSILRSTFWAVGGFDPDLKYIGEDTDLGSRLFNIGVQCKSEPEAVVKHHDTKNGLDYLYSILRCSGQYDVYCAREKKRRNDRLQFFARIHYGSYWRWVAHRVAWYIPWIFRLAASLCRKVTDTTGSRLSYRLWFKLGVGDYWKSVRDAGETVESLRDLFPPQPPIVMLHSISTRRERYLKSYCLSPHRFSRFMWWMKTAGYTSALPDEGQSCTSSSRRVILTFDDGYDDFLTEAFPVLQRFGFKATVFVVVDRIGKRNEWDESGGYPSRQLLSLDQIRDLHGHGVQFGSHTLTHPYLTNLSDRDLEREVRDSKCKLEDLLGTEVNSFSYPYGAVDMRVRGAVARAGYKVAVTAQRGLNCWEDRLCLKRVSVCEADSWIEFALKLATGKDFRQRTKEFLITRGLHRRLDRA